MGKILGLVTCFIMTLCEMLFGRSILFEKVVPRLSMQLSTNASRWEVGDTRHNKSATPCGCSRLERMFGFLENRLGATPQGFESLTLRSCYEKTELVSPKGYEFGFL